jgi:K+-transporting ATPase ATPase C chain
MRHLPVWVRRHLTALLALLALTVVTGVLYPLAVTGIAQVLFHGRAAGSMAVRNGTATGSSLIGQSFTDAGGRPLRQYFQSRPSAAGKGYDPTATSASNLGPEDVLDGGTRGRRSLLTQVCSRGRAVAELEGVPAARPYCTPDGVGAVLKVFRDHAVSANQACPSVPFIQVYQGMPVSCARPGEDYSAGRTVPVRGDAPAHPAVPPDAVTASGSGLDPDISVAYAELQAPRVARARGMPLARVERLIKEHTRGRSLGFMGEPAVNVLLLNLALDRLKH